MLRLASLFNRKARLWVRGRRGWARRLEESLAGAEHIVWMHCSSLGEFEQGRPVIEAIRGRHPGYRILLTFFSPSGYEIRKNYEGADWVFYLPLDTPRNARRFLRTVNPEITIFVKYEFWLNYLRRLGRGGYKTYLISAIFRRDSVFFRWYGGMFRRGLNAFGKIFVQDDASVELLAELGLRNAVVAGDTRFDRVVRIAAVAPQLPVVEKFAKGGMALVAGSTWPPDQEILLDVMASHPGLKFIVAPHEISRERIERFAARCPGGAVCYTALTPGSDTGTAQTLIIDTIGILSAVYRYGWAAYIGGGFGAGIHNTLEAATFGLPVAFGPNFARFREARELIEAGAARSIAQTEELQQWLTELQDVETHARTREAAAAYVWSHAGATDMILSEIFR